LMANETAHVLDNQLSEKSHQFIGGHALQTKKAKSGQLYTGPDHIVKKMTGIYGIGVRRK